jgi:hypothetical protein
VQSLLRVDCLVKIAILKDILQLVVGIEIGIDAVVEHLTTSLPSGMIVPSAMLVMKISNVHVRNQNESRSKE